MRPIGLTVATLGLYGLTLSRHYSADSLLIARAIEQGHLRHLAHPLLYPTGWAAYRLWQLLGWQGRALLPWQSLNALGGALCVGLTAYSLQRLTRSTAIAGWVAAGLAVSGGLWLLSTEGEGVTLPLAIQLAAVAWLLTAEEKRQHETAYAVGLGAVAALAIAFWLAAAWLLPAGALIFRQNEWSRRAQRRQISLFLVTALGLALPVIAVWGGGWPYPSGYARVSWRDLPHGVYALSRTVALFPGLSLNSSTAAFWQTATLGQRALWAGYYVGVAGLILSVVLGLWRARRRLWRTQPQAALAALCWVGSATALALAWVPGDLSFWLPVTVMGWWGVGWLAAQGEGWIRPNLLSLVCLSLALLNGLFFILPQHQAATNLPLTVAQRLAAESGPNDLLLATTPQALPIYLGYFTGRPTLAVYSNPPEASLAAEYSAALQDAVSQALAASRPVWLAQIGPAAWTEPLRALSLTLRPVWSENGASVFQVMPSP